MAELIWREISCQKAVSGNDFTQGVQDYNFSMGAPTAWIPAKSYFKIGLTITAKERDGTTPWAVAGGSTINDPPVTASLTAFADQAPSCLFNNVYFRAGGQDVSSLVNYVPQAAALKTRLQKTGAWQHSIGAAAFMIEPSFDKRVEKVASDSDVKEDDGGKRNTLEAIWQPPIGIFDHDAPLGSGDYRIQLNPNSDYKTACVQTINVAAGAGDFNVVVNSVKFYVATVKVAIPPGVETLHLMESLVQSKKVAGAGEQSLEFTVPASTRSLAVFVQSNASGSNTIVPPTLFKCLGSQEKALSSLQITYANTTKPSTRWDSALTNTTNRFQQRYIESQMESGMFFSTGGSETFQDFLNRGPYYLFTFSKDAMDKSTQVQLNVNFTAMEANANVFLAAFYDRATEIITENGQVQSVRSLNA